MAVTERAKEKLDEAGKEIREALDNLKQEVSELTQKVREKLKGARGEMRETAEELTQEVRGLSERVKDLIPKKRREDRLPVRYEAYPGSLPDIWEQPFLELRRSMDRLFECSFGSSGEFPAEMRRPWGLTTDFSGAEWPRVDMDETDDEIRLTAELPGVKKDDLDISVTGDRITIRGEKKEEEERKRRGYYTLERSYGSFHRSFSLPCDVESDQVNAVFRDGVLTLKCPKSAIAREQRRKISVRSG